MIETIEIRIHNGIREIINATLEFRENTLEIGKKKIPITEAWKKEIIQTIYLWKEEYGTDNNIDSEEFLVIVRTEEGEKTFHGKGIFPTNYDKLKELLGE